MNETVLKALSHCLDGCPVLPAAANPCQPHRAVLRCLVVWPSFLSLSSLVSPTASSVSRWTMASERGAGCSAGEYVAAVANVYGVSLGPAAVLVGLELPSTTAGLTITASGTSLPLATRTCRHQSAAAVCSTALVNVPPPSRG